MTHGSLFAGIGGFDLGFERAAIKTIWQVEINEFCRKVLARHFPGAARFEDIRECGAHNLRQVDVISGGFPCQDISNAGKRAGLDGERSGLWKEYLRIVRELRPQYAVLENVPALLSMGFGRILGELAESGYDAEWDCIPASAVGAPHRRDRIWIVAHGAIGGWGSGWARRPVTSSEGQSQQPLPEAIIEGLERHECEVLAGTFDRRSDADLGRPSSGTLRYPPVEGLPDWAGGTVGEPSPLTEFERSSGREIERDFRGMAHGVSRRVDRLKALGNAVVPQIAEWIGRRIVETYEPS